MSVTQKILTTWTQKGAGVLQARRLCHGCLLLEQLIKKNC